MMKAQRTTVAVISLLFFILIFPLAVASATTFTSCTVEGIDEAGQRLTIHTLKGDTWTIPVAHIDLLKGIHAGDRVTVEVDPAERIIKIVKLVSNLETLPLAAG
jgi:hypothetical protein